VFVQSVKAGTPAAGVTVEVLGRNGLPVVSENTDAQGHVHFPALGDFKREKAPVAFLARKGEDVSFLPFDRADRRLELSRFDVGGLVTGAKGTRLDAFLFSERGLYRPGDRVHLAAAVKSADWGAPLEGVPLEATVTDPRGMEVQKERLALPRSGFSELSFRTEETSPTGTYAASIYLVEANGNRGALLGSTSFRVEEFLPDRMRIAAHLSTERVEGWISPKDLSARVSLQNLFGVPAEKHRVAAEFTLEPAYPRFRSFKDYAFIDPLKAKNSYSESLEDGQTNEKGEVEFSLDLSRFAKATYRLGFVAQGFEADGGRSVSAASSVLVSPLAYLVGYKADGELRYVSRGAQRAVSLVAVGPDAAAREVKGLTAELLELRGVSVLQKKEDGTYRYESVQREISKEKKPLSIPAKGLTYALPTSDPGDFEVRIQDNEGLELSRIPFSVAGAGNLARNLEKNAELQIKLARSDWAPGESIELQITAPYVGAGLITIERNRVYAWKWFKTSTTSAVETIEVPADLEGNGYVSVAFVRALDSQEIFTSPLSFGVAPFSVSRAHRTIDIDLSTPEMARPGEVFPIRYRSSKPGKAVVFAVDEGILQVAKYKTPDPLGHFFEKRALEVSTQQILDLILPEFSVVQAVSASGGDEGQAALAHNLNPFKRKRDKPAVYWSGIVDIDEKERTLEWLVPDTFNGQVRVMVVAVSPEAVGANARDAVVRGPFVLSPNAPTFVAPGDAFEVSVAVANNVEGSGKAAKVKLEIAASEGLELAGAPERTLEIGEGRESSATFQVKATGKPGAATLRFVASLGAKKSKQTVDLSVRPAVPYETLIVGGQLKAGSEVEVPLTRHMTPEFRMLEASASPLPLCMARGLIQYLARYPHGCTEQIVSQAFPAIVLRDRPEFGFGPDKVEENLASALRTLRSRQNGEGAFGMWAGNGYVSDFQTVYAVHFLTETKERSYPVPPDLLSRGLAYVKGLAAGKPGSLGQARVQAYALYVLTRNGVVTTRELSAFREALDAHKDWPWKKDLTAVHLAATYAMLKQESQASRLIGEVRPGVQQLVDYDDFYDGLVYDAQLLYVLSRHFPARLKSLPPGALEAIARPIADGAYNSLSSAYTVLALDAYARAGGADLRKADASLAEVMANGEVRPLQVPEGLFPRVNFSEEARKLRVKSTGDLPMFWQATLAGFESSLPKSEVKQKLEIFREYQDASGKAVTEVRQGDELEVHLRVRSISGPASNVAVIDLLPGGFEPVLEQRVRNESAAETETSAARARSNPGDSDRPSDGEEGEEDSGDSEEAEPAVDQSAGTAESTPSVGALPIGLDKSSWIPQDADVREDRVVVYGLVGRDLKEFVYRIRATNRGTFTVPPPLGESMYDRSMKARGLPGQMKVVGRD
jgi:alpha-2-macroglobulin